MNPELEVIKKFLEEQFDLNCIFTKIDFIDKNCDVLLNRLFALINYEDEFYISFCLNSSTTFDVCFFSCELTLLLQEKIFPYREHYVDIKNGMLYFGDEAHNRNSEHINISKGIKLCPICDKHLPLQLFKDENEFCVICNKITLNSVTFH